MDNCVQILQLVTFYANNEIQRQILYAGFYDVVLMNTVNYHYIHEGANEE